MRMDLERRWVEGDDEGEKVEDEGGGDADGDGDGAEEKKEVKVVGKKEEVVGLDGVPNRVMGLLGAIGSATQNPGLSAAAAHAMLRQWTRTRLSESEGLIVSDDEEQEPEEAEPIAAMEVLTQLEQRGILKQLLCGEVLEGSESSIMEEAEGDHRGWDPGEVLVEIGMEAAAGCAERLAEVEQMRMEEKCRELEEVVLLKLGLKMADLER
ncbi:hypothetical protein BJ742DRAFT_485118 [Cladochytrium replicatum]|nr:hypothetical protein BJ742DRAFT_485118 [Cladochytrium replicatum]